MRLQSPASTGLLPASYSRRRRTRPNEHLLDGNIGTTYRDHYQDANNDPASSASIPGITYEDDYEDDDYTSTKKPPYTLETSTAIGDENDENDQSRGFNRQRSRNTTHSSSHDNVEKEDEKNTMPKPPTLADFLVNDRCYQRYLMEGKRMKYRGIKGSGSSGLGEGGKGWLNDSALIAKACAGASFVGMIFLIFVAVIIQTQPLYIKGVSMKQTNLPDDGTYRFRKETSNALKAAAAYFLLMVFSLIYLQMKDLNFERNPNVARMCHLRRLISSAYFRYRRRHYDDIPDSRHYRHHHHHSRGRRNSSPTLPMHHNENKMMKSTRRRKKNNSTVEWSGDISNNGGNNDDGGIFGILRSWGFGKGLVQFNCV